MKKFIPILTLIGTAGLVVGYDTKINSKTIDYSSNIKDFKESVIQYNQTNPENLTKTVANYQLNIVDDPNLDETEKQLSTMEELIKPDSNSQTDSNLHMENELVSTPNETTSNDTTAETPLNETTNTDNPTLEDSTPNADSETNTPDDDLQISTLYYLTTDIQENCNEFCELKTKILNAIAESENLSEKLRNNELELTREQRIFIDEQANQLKMLSKQLTLATNELSFNLSDLNAIIKENNPDLDSLSLKYLIILNNLINGNEMLESGLGSLNLINNMMQINAKNLQPNNKSRILYGFHENGNAPIIKEYSLNENGELEGSLIEQSNISADENSEVDNKIKNIDSYKHSRLTPNIDSYGNNRRNIDSFFNTALFDNEFMYGGNYGFGAYGNPNLYQFGNYEQTNKLNNETVNNSNNMSSKQSNEKPHKHKKFKLKNNIDTYKDENTLDVKTKMKNFKSSINNFFNKVKIEPRNNIETPLYKFED